MASETIIAWTSKTFNIAWGCTKVSPGCDNCYADTLSTRYGWSVWGKNGKRRTFGEKHWAEPLKWDEEAQKKGEPFRVFTSSMCDVFEDHPVINAEREKLWDLIRRTPNLHWQVLTKRARSIKAKLPPDWGKDGFPNVWLGVSIENIDFAWRVKCLSEIPAVVRFISYEPALGPLDDLDLTGIDWVIVGGESGPGYRMMDHGWARSMRRKCKTQGVSFFFKQSSAIRTEMGIKLDGEIVREYPIPRKAIRDGGLL